MKQRAKLLYFAIAALAAFSFCACSSINRKQQTGDAAVRLGGQTLSHTQLDELTRQASTPEDSALLADAYIRQWAGDVLFYDKASKFKDPEIEELVEAYRRQLYVKRYEDKLVSSKMDQTLDMDTIQAYYEKHPELFRLHTSLVQGVILTIPEGAPNLQKLKGWLQHPMQEIEKIEKYAYQYATGYELFVDRWKTSNQIMLKMPIAEDALNASLSSKRYTFNNSHLLAGNWLWKTGKDSDFRLQGNGFIDKENMRDYTSSTYITLADLPVVTEEQIVTNHRSEWKGEASYQMNGNNTFVRDNLKGYADFNDSKGLMLLQDQRTDMLIKPNKRYITNDFELSHTNAQKNVYDFRSYLSYNYLPGQVLTINNQTEHLNLRFFSTQNSLRFRKRLAKHYLNNQIGADFDCQNIGVAMDNENEADNTYRLSQLYWTPSMSFNFADHKVEGSVKVCYAHQSYRESSSDHILLDPSLRWNWKATSLSDFSARLSYSNSPLMGKAIYDTPIFTGYRTQRSGRGETDITHTLSVTASYKYTNPISGTFFNIAPIYKRSMGNILYKTVLNSDIYTMEASEQESTTTTKGVSSRYSKSFGWAKTVLDLSASYMMTDYGLLAMDKVNKGRMHSSVLSFNYSLRPIRVLSLEGKSSAIISKQENRSLKNMSSGSITDWNHSLDLHVFPKKGWMISVKNELFDSSERSIDVNYFCDLSLSYKSKSWEIAFDGNNIFGTSEFERRILGNTIETYSVTRLRPREFIVKVCFGN